jgi:Lon protease-like protein
MATQLELPLMPLNAVLFPWMPVVLSIYEERYLLMLRHCLAQARLFGTALIAAGREVGGPADPHRVGTEVVIARAWPTDDGSWRVVGVGRRRFTILRMLQQDPYPAAEVDYGGLAEVSTAPTELVRQARELFAEHLRLLTALLGPASRELAIPDAPAPLSYMIAAHLGVSPAERQHLLEIPTTAERLQAELPLLRQDLSKLRLVAAAQKTDPSQAARN